MRILVVHPRMSIKGGGERVAIHSMIAGLNSRHDVSLLSEEFDQDEFEDFFGCNGLFSRVDWLKYPAFKPCLGNRLLLYQRLVYHQRQIRKTLSGQPGFDLVLGTQDVGYVPKVDAPIVQYCYFPEYFTHLESNPLSRAWRSYYWPASIYYKDRVSKISELLAVSDYTRNFVMRKWGRYAETLYPPCPTELYATRNDSKQNQVITVGRIVPEKRIHLFAEAARKLPRFNFVVIGSIDQSRLNYFERLKSAAPKNLSFVLSPLRKAKDFLTSSKVYVHCTLNEHFGITIVEAMAAGCVPVVHDSGGPREIVGSNIGFRWQDIDEAVGQISILMTNDPLREGMAKAAEIKSREYNPEIFESHMGSVFKRHCHRLAT